MGSALVTLKLTVVRGCIHYLSVGDAPSSCTYCFLPEVMLCTGMTIVLVKEQMVEW